MPRGRGAEQIAERRPVLRQHDVELRDELAQIILPVVHEPRTGAREFAQALDRLVGHVAGLGGPRADEPGDDVGVDVIGLSLAADDVAVAPGLQRIQHQDAVARADERRFEIFPEVARGLESDQGLHRRRVASGQRPQQCGHAVFAGGDGEALADSFAVTVQDGNPVLPQRHIDSDKPLRHGTPFPRRRGTARISRTGATGREVSMAWSLARLVPARGHLCRQNPEGSQASRPPRTAADQVRAGGQSQDCEGHRADDPAGAATASRPSDRVAVLDQRGHLLNAHRQYFSSARLPAAILTEVRMRWIGLAVVLSVLAPLVAEPQPAAKMLNALVRSGAVGSGPGSTPASRDSRRNRVLFGEVGRVRQSSLHADFRLGTRGSHRDKRSRAGVRAPARGCRGYSGWQAAAGHPRRGRLPRA